jgi:hypothetical protein
MKRLFALLLALACTAAQPADIAQQGEALRVSGMIEDSDTAQFRSLLDANPGLQRVVFDRCLGGTVSAALEFAALIRAHRLATVASVQTSSACAMAFLAGRERSYDDSVPVTSIVLHAGRRRDGQPASDAVNRRILMFLETATDGKLSPELLALVRGAWSEAAGVLFVRSRAGGLQRDEVRWCDGSQGRDIDRCRRLPAFDPVSQGIVTRP